MDVDLLKSATEDQMEMMVMMQMDKLSAEFLGPYSSSDMPPSSLELSTGSASSIDLTQPILDNSPPLFPPSISFTNNSISQTMPMPLSMSNAGPGAFTSPSPKSSSMVSMRDMIFRIAAMQPIHIDPESVKPPKRRNVKISKDPQSVAARHRRERISEKIRILQRLVPGGTKMDTASMLDEAVHYVKFLKGQVQSLERAAITSRPPTGFGFPTMAVCNANQSSLTKGFNQGVHHQMFSANNQMLS